MDEFEGVPTLCGCKSELKGGKGVRVGEGLTRQSGDTRTTVGFVRESAPWRVYRRSALYARSGAGEQMCVLCFRVGAVGGCVGWQGEAARSLCL